MKFVPKSPIDSKPVLFHVMAWSHYFELVFNLIDLYIIT